MCGFDRTTWRLSMSGQQGPCERARHRVAGPRRFPVGGLCGTPARAWRLSRRSRVGFRAALSLLSQSRRVCRRLFSRISVIVGTPPGGGAWLWPVSELESAVIANSPIHMFTKEHARTTVFGACLHRKYGSLHTGADAVSDRLKLKVVREPGMQIKARQPSAIRRAVRALIRPTAPVSASRTSRWKVPNASFARRSNTRLPITARASRSCIKATY